MAALSATGAPTPKTVALLERSGVGPDLAGPLLHVAPLVIAVAAWFLMRVLAHGRGATGRALIYAGVGGAVGFALAFCLDLFVGVLSAIERITGPLRESGKLDLIAWTVAGVSFFWAALMALAAMFGAPALRAMTSEQADPECFDVRGRERRHFAVSAIGMAGQGLFVGALAVAHQLDTASAVVRLGVAGAVALGAFAFAWSSWTLWRDFDELQRRAVVEAYAWSGFIASIGCLAWATLESLALAPPLTAFGAVVALVILQTVATFVVTASLSLAGGLAQERAA
jgi:hypothetical protein